MWLKLAVKSLFFLLVLVLISVKSEVSFKNVSIWISQYEKFTTIKSGSTLKSQLRNQSFPIIMLTGTIPILYENAISNMKMRELYLHHNGLKDIQVGAFRNLSELEVLEISKSNLSQIKSRIFSDLPITHLYLSQDSIKTIQLGAFENLPNLQTLSLSENKLETLEDSVFDGLTIDTLDISGNSLTALQEKIFDKLPNLQKINLAFNHLTEIPKGVFTNLPLLSLQLENNKISKIDAKAFDNMTNLVSITLSSNKLTKYDPQWFHNTTKIYKLYLSNNLIEEIPMAAFKNIYNDKEQWVRLDGNKITKISPTAFDGFKKLDTLHLSDNKIETWDDQILAHVEIIYYLNLVNNRIRKIDGEFDQIFKANYTYLGENPLEDETKRRIEHWMALTRSNKTVCTQICHLH